MVSTREDVLGTIARFHRTRGSQFGLVRIGVLGLTPPRPACR